MHHSCIMCRMQGPRDRSQLSDEDYKEKWTRQIPGWQAAATRGHEVGNHTVDHPCSCNFDFGDSHLEGMSLDDIAHTIDVATRRLDALIPEQGGARRSFCYPCYQTFVGVGVEKQSYIPVVAERFLAARGGGRRRIGRQDRRRDRKKEKGQSQSHQGILSRSAAAGWSPSRSSRRARPS